MRALVTGSAGFLGRHFVAELRARGWKVEPCDPRDDWPERDALDLQAPEVDDWNSARYDLVVHAAARSPHRLAIDTQPANHVYNRLLDAAMFDWAIGTKQRRVLYLSSCAVLDTTVDAYGSYKLAGEQLAEHARAAGVPVTVVRPYSGYGEDQSADFPFGAFVARAKRREDPFTIWGSGNQVRDWIHVDDVVRGALAVVESETAEPVSLCTGLGTSLQVLAGMVCEAAGYRPEFRLDREKPAAARRRVGDPRMLQRWYTPQVSIEDGVKRALA